MLTERNDNTNLPAPSSSKPKLTLIPSQKLQKENQQPKKNNPENKPKPNPIKELTDPKKAFRLTETNKIKKDNLKKILSRELSRCRQNFRTNILDKHCVSSEVRARMVGSKGRLDDRSVEFFRLFSQHLLCFC